MTRSPHLLILLLAQPLLGMTTNPSPIRTTADLREFRSGETPEFRALDISAQVTLVKKRTIVIEDETGRAELVYLHGDVARGDLVRLRGVTSLNERMIPWDHPEKAEILGRRAPPAPLAVTLGQLDFTGDDLKHIITEGVVITSFGDEIDALFRILIIKDGSVKLPVYIEKTNNVPDHIPETGARIRVSGVFYRSINCFRFYQQPSIVCDRIDVLTPPPADPFDVPELKGRTQLTLSEIAALGQRKVAGKVLATWDGNRLMLKAARDKIIFARLQDKVTLPSPGDFIVLLGEPDADFFNITLENALWKPSPPVEVGEDECPADVSPADIFRETPGGRKNIEVNYQGALIRLSGTLLSHSSAHLTVSCDSHTVPVDVSVLPDGARSLPDGTKLRITGRCLLESTKKTSYDIFPQITGFSVITRAPADIETLSLPPWWTPTRLFGLIAALLAVLLGFVIWNRVLNHLVQKRSRELSRAEVAKVSSELRVGERTRLAVELHDTLSQNLTGIALAINAGEYVLAEKSLRFCREELKNCLWDLRNDALDEADMNEAIRRTLTPHIGNAKLAIRFGLPRNTLTDNTAHTILRIVRELAVNAIRHGGATEIRVAGSVEEHRILFSVRDNGRGFDPMNAPGMDKGHFGLQGIRDRIKQMNGEMRIESSPTTGTKVSIWLKSKC